jgi:hypothetical protein
MRATLYGWRMDCIHINLDRDHWWVCNKSVQVRSVRMQLLYIAACCLMWTFPNSTVRVYSVASSFQFSSLSFAQSVGHI